MRGTPIPHDFELSDVMRAWAEVNVPMVNAEKEFEKFKDYFLASGKQMVDWHATLRNWLRRCVEFKGACLYTADEMRLKKLKAQYVAEGFRPPRGYENSTMYEYEYGVWKRGLAKPRDMSAVVSLIREKTA